MPDGLSVAVANAALNNIVGTNWNDVQLHTAGPGTAGTTAVSTVTARQSVTWASASNASNLSTVAASNQPQWTSWAGTNGEVETDTSYWSAPTSGTFGGSVPLSASVTMDTGDSLQLTSISISVPSAS
jgi:hypothetical protein